MTKDAGGTWSLTLGPLAPEIYEYYFLADGAKVLDVENKVLKMGSFSASLLDVPGELPRSIKYKTCRMELCKFVPIRPRLTRSSERCPSISHRSTIVSPCADFRFSTCGDDETTWTLEGRAGVILENLIAEGKALPMIIVMPYGESNSSGGGTRVGIAALGKELLDDIIPLVEKNYRTLSGRDNRAIAGLSMGGGQAFTIGLDHLDQFAWVGEFSSGLLSDADFRIEKYMPGLVENAPSMNQKLKLLFLSCGSEDARYQGQIDLRDALAQYNIGHEWYATPGSHEWKVWRHSLQAFLPRLFQPMMM